jgi:hypothetical protein
MEAPQHQDHDYESQLSPTFALPFHFILIDSSKGANRILYESRMPLTKC